MASIGLGDVLFYVIMICCLFILMELTDFIYFSQNETSFEARLKNSNNHLNTSYTDDTSNVVSSSSSSSRKKQSLPIYYKENPKIERSGRTFRFNHVGMNGLGHKFSKLSSVYHYAIRINAVTTIETDWKRCSYEPNYTSTEKYRSNIWDKLFGPDHIEIPHQSKFLPEINTSVINFCMDTCCSNVSQMVRNTTQVIRWINECPNYSASKYISDKKLMDLPFYLSKLRTDEDFYQLMQSRFIKLHRLKFESFFERFGNFDDKVTLGLHVRVGNVNDKDFVIKNRFIRDIPSFCNNLLQLIWKYVQRHELLHYYSPPIQLFVATDGHVVLQYLNESINNNSYPIQLLYFEQDEIEFTGMEFSSSANATQTKQYETCINSWVNSMIDMVLLGMTDVLFAGLYSSYTQTLPLSMMFGSPPTHKYNYTLNKSNPTSWPLYFELFPRFCEVGPSATAMNCHFHFDSLLGLNIDDQTVLNYQLYNTSESDRSTWTIYNQQVHEFGLPEQPGQSCRLIG